MRRNKLVLFDIDHTLLDVGESHKQAFRDAFKEVYALESYQERRYDGFTDLQILLDVIARNKLQHDERKIAALIESAVKHFRKKDLSHARLLDGVTESLDRLRKHAILGLVTGNIREIAFMKLKHLGIDGYFLIGGFGEKSARRADLVEQAVKDAEKRFGHISKSDVFIIGDTAHDITAAQLAGVKAIAVATGKYRAEELQHMNPLYVALTLKDKNIAELIING